MVPWFRWIALLLTTLAAVGPSLTDVASSYAEMAPPADCTVLGVAGKIIEKEVNDQVTLSKPIEPITDELRALTAKAKEPNKPIGGQLSFQDAGRFSALSQRMLFIQLNMYIESEHARDATVLSRLWQISKADYEADLQPDDGQPDYPYFAILQLIRLLVGEKLEINEPRHLDICDFDTALSLSEDEAVRQLNALGPSIKEATQGLKTLLRHYEKPGQKVDPSAMSPEDRETYRAIMEIEKQAQKPETFIRDMEALKILARLSDTKHQLNYDDLVRTGGDVKSMGTSFDALPKNETEQFFLGIMEMIRKKYPSQMASMIQALNKELEQNGSPQ